MVVRTVLLTVLLSLVAFNASADREVGEGGLRVKILGRSGKIRIARDAGGRSRNLSRDDGAFVVEVDHVKQKNALGSDVGKNVETLANQDFSIDVNKSANYQGVSAAHINLKSYLDAPKAHLIVDIYIFRATGNVTFGNETTEVQNGTMKFFVEIKNYTFCDGQAIPSICRANEVGKYLEVAIVVKGKKGETPEAENEADRKNREDRRPTGKRPKGMRCPLTEDRCPKTYRIGNDTIGLSKECKNDGENVKMPEGYPRFVRQGSKNRFIFRCNKFNRTVIFDPYVEVSEGDDTDDSPMPPTDSSPMPPTDSSPMVPTENATSIHVNVFMFITLLATCFM
ncbi:hypothetical protein ABFA07_013421 [Porites harrisoni]